LLLVDHVDLSTAPAVLQSTHAINSTLKIQY